MRLSSSALGCAARRQCLQAYLWLEVARVVEGRTVVAPGDHSAVEQAPAVVKRRSLQGARLVEEQRLCRELRNRREAKVSCVASRGVPRRPIEDRLVEQVAGDGDFSESGEAPLWGARRKAPCHVDDVEA